MKGLSKREITMLVFLGIILILAGYYNFFLKGYLDRNSNLSIEITQLKSDINDAKFKNAAIAIADKKIEEVSLEIEKYDKTVMQGMDRTQIINMLNKQVYPYITNSTVSFSESYTDLGANYMYNIDIIFMSDLDKLDIILENLRQEKIANRILNASINITDINTKLCSCRISIDILTGTDSVYSFKAE